MTEQVRRRVFFSGRVQGVGFRHTTRVIAAQHSVTGYVRNLPDARVEVVAEGDLNEIDRFFAAVIDEMRGYIRGSAIENSEASGEFSGFEIRY